jgi:hypothetical protein
MNNIKGILNVLSLMALLMVVQSCKRNNDEYVGPKQVEAKDGFAILSYSDNNYNSNTGVKTAVTLRQIFFNALERRYVVDAKFNQEVTWYLTIEQPKTGAQWKTQGTSNKIDSSTFQWRGQSSNNIFFNGGFLFDSVYVTLSFLGTEFKHVSPLRYRANAGGAGRYKEYYASMGRNMILVDNFDNGSQYDGSTEWTDSRLKQEFFDAVDGTVILENSYDHYIDGTRSFRMKGTDYNKNAYIGGVNTFSLSSLCSRTPGAKKNLMDESDPNELYVNFFLYGVVNQSAVQVKVYEIDNTDNFRPDNTTFVYDGDAQKYNDAWTYDIVVNWTGWKLVSLRYKDFKRANDPNFGGNGNGVLEPLKVTGLAITLTSQEAYPNGEVYIDYVNFTSGGPFIP